MSTTETHDLVYRTKAKSTSDDRRLLCVEHANNKDFNKTTNVTFFNKNDIKDVTFCANTYVRISCLIEYFNTRFEHCEVVITDRFTMDSERFTMVYTEAAPNNYYNKQIKNYSIAQFAYDTQAREDDDERLNNKKFTYVTLVLSMADFPHFGDAYFLFYGQNATEKDKYCDPVIVQFTNAPTVIVGNVYKWHPHNNAQDVMDSDNIFADKFGAFWNVDENKRGIADSGRTNVLSGDSNQSEFYNDFLDNNRLLTNGIRYWEASNSPNSVLESVSGHPLYIAHYDTFVPKTFSDVYGIEQRPVKFTSEALHKNELGENCAAYLTTSDNYSTSASRDDAFNIRIVEVDDKAYNLIAVSSGDNIVVASIPGQHQRFNAYLGCISGAPAEKLRDGNGTAFNNRKTDDWYRKHTMLHADFSLTHIDPYWLSTTEEIVTDYTERSYRIINNYENYIPPVIERVWVNHDWGTRYYVLKKGYLNDKYNPENWIRIYNYPYRHRNDSSSVITENTELLSNIEVDDDGVPILILEHTGNVGYGIDIKHTYYDESIGNTCSFILSCDDDKKKPRFFKIMDLITTATTRTVIFRVSDMATIGDFGRSSADAEWAITVPR